MLDDVLQEALKWLHAPIDRFILLLQVGIEEVVVETVIRDAYFVVISASGVRKPGRMAIGGLQRSYPGAFCRGDISGLNMMKCIPELESELPSVY